MKKNKRKHPAEQTRPHGPLANPKHGFTIRFWHLLAGFAVALTVALVTYAPALRGPFLFDDVYLPFYLPGYEEQPLAAWLAGLRPVLMFTFWANYRISEVDPASYHFVNVFIHSVNALLVFLIARRLISLSLIEGEKRNLLAVFAAAFFLLHPLQTESVAYIASRSENLSGLFLLAAFAVFVYRAIPAISFPASLAVLTLFGLACLTKEHSAVLPALLLLTDYFWNPGFSLQGIRRNWKLYAPLAAAAAAGGVFVMRVLMASNTAGFSMRDLPWHHYLFTQCRVIWSYIRMAVLPFGQNVDHDVQISRNLMDNLAVFGLMGLILVTIAAWYFRRQFPLASYGWLMFLVLLAPTSSIVPIRDVIAERRMYLPLIGLLLIAIEFLSRVRLTHKALATGLAAVVVIFGVLTWNRNQVWSSPIALWEDTVAKSSKKARPHFQLAYAYYNANRCNDALPHYESAGRFEPPERALLIDWALALDCANRPADALAKLEQAAAMKRDAHIYSLIGMIHGKAGRREDALAALETAAKLDPYFDMTYVYRGNVYATSGQFDLAAAEYSRALAINPDNDMARDGLAMSRRRPKL
jgi:tetratricopeptide (TPR) repeat protein